MVTELRLLIARHPETEANTKGLWVGRGNTPFTPLGLAQVDAIAREIEAFAPARVLSSPLERTRVPAERGAGLLGVAHEIDERLSELHFGAAEGLTFDQARVRGIDFDFKSLDAPVAAGGESRREILARTAAVLDEVLAAEERVAIVTHGGVFRSALVHLLGLPVDAIWAFHIRNAAIAELSVRNDGEGGRWKCLEEFRVAG